MNIINIGFDLDGIFIQGPILIPKRLVEWLYRGPQNHQIRYRFPTTKIEQLIRRWSHYPFFRPQISKNVEFLNKFSSSPKHQIFLISSRYKFLEDLTMLLLQKNGLKDCFSKIYLNTKNEQPHLFKRRIVENLKIDIYVEDDLIVLKYLQEFCPKIKLLWYNANNTTKTFNGILHIKSLKEIYSYLK